MKAKADLAVENVKLKNQVDELKLINLRNLVLAVKENHKLQKENKRLTRNFKSLESACDELGYNQTIPRGR